MTQKVRCISPHGGCRNGQYHNGHPVEHIWNADTGEWALPEIDPAKLRLPPSPGGYIDNAVLGTCAVGQVYDAPDGFMPDGFHFEAVTQPPRPAAPLAPPSPDKGE